MRNEGGELHSETDEARAGSTPQGAGAKMFVASLELAFLDEDLLVEDATADADQNFLNLRSVGHRL